MYKKSGNGIEECDDKSKKSSKYKECNISNFIISNFTIDIHSWFAMFLLRLINLSERILHFIC